MQKKPLTNRRLIADFLKGATPYFALGMVLATLSALAEMVRPKIIQYTVDGILGQGSLPALLSRTFTVEWLRQNLWLPAVAVVVFTAAAEALRYGYHICTAKGGERFVKTMRDELFGHIQQLGAVWHSAHKTGDIIQRCTSDVEEVKVFLSEQLVNLLTMVLTILLSLVFMFRIDWRLTLVGVASIPILVGSSLWFHDKIKTNFRICDENEGALSSIAQENLTGVRVVRAFGREQTEQQRFADQNVIVTAAWVKLGRYMSIYFSCMDCVTGLMVLALLSWGSARCVAGQTTVGGLLAILSYMGMLIRPVRRLGRVLNEMSKTDVSITRLREIMEAPVEADPPEAQTPPMDGDVVFDHVTFGYPNQPELLHDVSFTIPAGSTLGILGGTGSGKSTLMQLLSRLYPLPEEGGTITVGGVDIRRMKASWVRRNVGYVLQEPFLFSRSIAENIALARPELDEAGIRTAARAACLEKVVDGFPKGFDTFVGERGVTLSGGQKQRTAIARTLTLNAPILIFDDSLSAVDAETDALIRENLRRYMGNATVILISHRITTLMAADNILVLEGGHITAQGTHAELAAQPGLYRTICEIQDADTQIAAPEGGADHAE